MIFQDRLKQLGACDEAREWAKGMTAQQAWETCERGDWLLWWAQKEDCELRQLTLAKARCAKLVLHLMTDERSIKAVEVAEQFGLGNATREELNTVANAAYVAAYAAAYVAAYAAAYAAADAAYAAYAAADAAYAAYVAADAAAYAAYVAADATRSKTLKQCADIVRENIKPTWI